MHLAAPDRQRYDYLYDAIQHYYCAQGPASSALARENDDALPSISLTTSILILPT